MNLQLAHCARAMRRHNYPIRSTPVDYTPMEERRRLLECMLVHTWRLASALHISLGALPMIVTKDDRSFHMEDVLDAVSRIHVDTLTAFHAFGTADVAKDAVEAVLDQHAHPPYTPNFRAILTDARDDSHEFPSFD